MKILVIVNKNAGSFRTEKEDHSLKKIQNTFENINIDCNIIIAEGAELFETAKSAAEFNIDAIVAAGGDGTISAIASALTGTDRALGVLPLGTLNHFAKDLCIPLEIEEAVKLIAENNVKKIDTGEVNGKIFINNSSIGFYPKVVKKRDEQIERIGKNKWLAMALAIIRVFNRFSSIEVDVDLTRQKKNVKVPFVFIGNNVYKFDLFNLGSRIELDKGKLSIYFPNTTGRFAMIRFAFLALIHKLNQTKDFNIIESECVTIKN